MRHSQLAHFAEKGTASGKETSHRSISPGVPEDGCRAVEELRQHRRAIPGTGGTPATAIQMAGSVGADRRRRRATGKLPRELENGCPLDVIGKVLGHDNLDITAHYAQVSTRLMMRAYNAAHPHARLDVKKAREDPGNA